MRYFFQGTSKDGTGRVVCDATISIYLAGSTTVASIYTSLTGTSAVNSTTSGSATSPAPGHWSFYTDAWDYDSEQTYKIVISKSGFNPQTYDNVKGEVVLGTYTISTAKTATTHIVIPKGVLYAKSGSGSMAFNGPPEIGLYQVFSGFSAGDVTFGSGSVKEVYPEWWGENTVPGTTDMTDEIKSAVGSIVSIRGIVRLMSQNYLVTSEIPITGGITILGQSRYFTIISLSSATQNGFKIETDDPVILKNFRIDCNGVSTAGSAISLDGTTPGVTQNVYSNIENIDIRDSYIGINLISAASYNISKSLIGTRYINIQVDNLSNADSGNGRIFSNEFSQSAIPPGNTYGIVQLAAGGLKIYGNHFFGQTIGYRMNLRDTAATGHLNIFGNVFEPMDSRAISFEKQTANGSFNNINITGNIFSASPDGAVHTVLGSALIINFSICSNVFYCGATGKAIYLLSGDGGVIDSNNFFGLAGTSLGIYMANEPTHWKIGKGNNFYNLTTYVSVAGYIDLVRAFADGDTTPSVAESDFFYTGNTNPTVITTFHNGWMTKKFVVRFGDTQTTIDFTGTDLKGNTGVDWTPAAGDWMECWFDGTNWYCAVHDTTAQDIEGGYKWLTDLK